LSSLNFLFFHQNQSGDLIYLSTFFSSGECPTSVASIHPVRRMISGWLILADADLL
jgi:hypothetical protein